MASGILEDKFCVLGLGLGLEGPGLGLEGPVLGLECPGLGLGLECPGLEKSQPTKTVIHVTLTPLTDFGQVCSE